MTLKKPSDYFKKESLSVDNSIQELEKEPVLSVFSDTFESFKNNLSKIEVLSESLDTYQVNIEKVNFISEKVEGIQTEIQNLIKKEDLDRALIAQLLVVEKSIIDVQTKVKSINKKNLKEIRSDVAGLTESVSEFLEIEVPRYKKLVVDSELRTSKRYEELEENVSETLDEIQELVEDKYKKLQQNLQGINEQKLLEIIDNFKVLDQTILELKEQEIPKYKNLIVETERKTESKLIEFDEKLEETLDGFVVSFDEKVDQKIDNLHNSIEEVNKNFENLKEQEIPKYKNLIVETERKTESKLIEFDEKLNQTLTDVVQKINLVEGDKTDLVKIVNNKIQEIQNIKDNVVKDLKFGEDYKNEIDKKVIDLEIEIIRNESHIKVQNQNLEQIQENVRSVIDKLNLEEIEEQNYELGKKIKYLEEIFDKFNEKEFLSETIIVEPPSTNNKDSLTPLDKNFVTLEQLQQHYRLFINRIQQQLATIGGGGETRFEFLDDVDRDSVKQNGYIARYDSSIGKFIGTSYDSNVVSSQWVTTTSGIHTLSAVGIGTTNPQASLEVVSNIPGGGIRVSAFGTNSPGFRLLGNNDILNFSAQNLLVLSPGHGLTNSQPGDYIIRNNAGGSIIFGVSTTSGSTTTTGFVRITPNSELLVGTASSIPTGTASQPLQVTGGAYVSGSVGIGTTNPVNTLQVFGGIVAGNATSATSQSGFSILRPNDSTPRTFAIAETDTDLRIGGGAWNNVNIRTAPSNDIRVAITSSGNIGIGTTNPLGPLQIGYAGTHVSFIIDSNGNLGLGTITPTSTISEGVAHRTLHFYSPNSRQVSLRLDNGNTGGNAWLLQSSGGLAGNGQGKFSIFDNNNATHRFTIDSLGNTGIGTTNPSSTLHVQGNALITGVTTSSGFNATTGNTYQINGTTVLSNNTLGSGVVNSSLTSVGTLGVLNVSGITTTGTHNVTTGNTYQINGTTVLSNNTLGSGVVNSSLTSVGTLNQLNVSGVVTSTTYNTGLIGSQTSGILTTTSTTTNQVLDNLPTSTFQAARYQVSIACTGQLITAGMSPSVTSVGAITVGSGYTVATYTNVSLTGGSGNDALANIGIGLSFNSVGFTSAIDLIVTTTEHGLPSGVGTIAVSFASSIPNTDFTGFAVTAGNIYYAVGVGTTTLRLFNNAAGTSQIIGIGTTVFSGVGNTMTKSGGVSSVQIVSPGSGYAVGNNLSATLGTIGSGFSFTVSRVVRNYQSTDVMIMHSVGSASTDCDYVEYASIANNEILGSFGADISGTNARLLFTPTYRNNTIKYIRTGITV